MRLISSTKDTATVMQAAAHLHIWQQPQELKRYTLNHQADMAGQRSKEDTMTRTGHGYLKVWTKVIMFPSLLAEPVDVPHGPDTNTMLNV